MELLIKNPESRLFTQHHDIEPLILTGPPRKRLGWMFIVLSILLSPIVFFGTADVPLIARIVGAGFVVFLLVLGLKIVLGPSVKVLDDDDR